LELFTLPKEIFHEPEQLPAPCQSARFQAFALLKKFSPPPATGSIRDIQPFKKRVSFIGRLPRLPAVSPG